MAEIVDAEPLAERDYVDVVDCDTLEPVEEFTAGAELRLLAAARVGKPRLLDNIGVVVPEPGTG
jgi:pantoate--beta-alanine ligase